MKYDYVIAGAGFAGCVLAERLASQLDKKVLLIDKRPHIGGNAYDEVDEAGIRVHRYGPHLFHTNDETIVRYLSHFTEWHPYEHRVMSFVNGTFVPMPINRRTVNTLFGMELSNDEQVKDFFDRERVDLTNIATSEDVVLSKVGKRLYELLYRGYTVKHWGIDPSKLAPAVCGRIPVRTDLNDRYFDDRYQMMPRDGYSALFAKMTGHPNITVSVKTGFSDVPVSSYDRVIFTGPIDEYFGFIHGKLPYRSLRFEFETLNCDQFQPVTVVNYPNDELFTRITEFNHITGKKTGMTTIAREFAMENGDPYYPVPNAGNDSMYRKYETEAEKLSTVHFVGRLATYRYYNMDQVVGQALKTFKTIAGRR